MQHPNLRQSQPPWPQNGLQHELEREGRIVRAEMTLEQHGHRLDHHDSRHEAQDVWNKGFTVALMGLGSGLAHAKAGELLDFLAALLRGLKP